MSENTLKRTLNDIPIKALKRTMDNPSKDLIQNFS